MVINNHSVMLALTEPPDGALLDMIEASICLKVCCGYRMSYSNLAQLKSRDLSHPPEVMIGDRPHYRWADLKAWAENRQRKPWTRRAA